MTPSLFLVAMLASLARHIILCNVCFFDVQVLTKHKYDLHPCERSEHSDRRSRRKKREGVIGGTVGFPYLSSIFHVGTALECRNGLGM